MRVQDIIGGYLLLSPDSSDVFSAVGSVLLGNGVFKCLDHLAYSRFMHKLLRISHTQELSDRYVLLNNRDMYTLI